MSAAEDLQRELGEPKPKKTTPRRTNGTNGESAFDLANRVSTTQILDRYGIEHDGEKFTDCPGCAEPKAKLCEGGGTKCLHARCSHVGPPGKPGFRTPVDIVAERERVEPLEAAKLICDWHGIELPKSRERTPEQPPDDFGPVEHDDAPEAEPQSEAQPVAFPKLGAAEIFAPLPPVPYLVEGLDFCPGPPNLVAGYGFSGKTVTLQALAVATVSGRRAWGAFSVRQGRVLHLDYEQGRRLTCERYQRLARVESLTPDEMAGLDVVCLPPLYLDTLDAEAALIRECEGYALVIVDSLRACAPHVDENSSEVRSVLDMLHRVSDKTGATFVVVHHARKPQRDAPGGARMAIRGSGALFDAAASVLVLEAQKGEPVRAIHEKARTSGRPTDDFLLTIDDVEVDGNPRGGLACRAEAAPSREVVTEETEATKRRQRTANLADELRDLFRREPEHQGADGIAAKLGRRVPDVREALALLTDSGEVIVTGKSRDRRHQWAGRE